MVRLTDEEMEGDAVCTPDKALRMFGTAARYSMCELAWDPIPKEADDVAQKTWNGESGDS